MSIQNIRKLLTVQEREVQEKKGHEKSFWGRKFKIKHLKNGILIMEDMKRKMILVFFKYIKRWFLRKKKKFSILISF